MINSSLYFLILSMRSLCVLDIGTLFAASCVRSCNFDMLECAPRHLSIAICQFFCASPASVGLGAPWKNVIEYRFQQLKSVTFLVFKIFLNVVLFPFQKYLVNYF